MKQKIKFLTKKIQKIFKNKRKGVSEKRKILSLKNVLLGLGIGSIILYFLALFFAEKLQILATFPGTDINLKEITNHPAGILVAEDVEFLSSLGEKITGLYIDNNSEKVVYYFHGNGGPLEYFYSDIQYISDLGYSVIALEYPGYGDSTGKPSFEETRDFAQVFYENMKSQLDFEEKDMIVWGYSVGTAVAVEFAKDKDFDALVLFSPLASRYDMGKKLLGFPIQKLFFLPDSFVSKQTIKLISEPTLIVHGNTDKVVPFDQGKMVFENSPAEKKYFIEIDDFGHSLIPERYGGVLRGYIENFLKNYQLEKQETLLDRELAVQLLEKLQYERKIMSFDIMSDDSLQKYIDSNVPFTELDYIPQDMRELNEEYIFDAKGDLQMREEAANNFEKMAEKFYEDMGEKIVVVSSYRSYAYQAGIKARGCPDNLCAKAGYSEHQSGLAVDFWSASTQQYWNNSARLTKFYNWLYENAHLYGFHNSYQNGLEIDGYEIEPWHWRYLGVELASYLRQQEITFAKYYKIRMQR